jgi:hypothetical protein
VSKLQEHKDMKFIWAEISYLSLWWAEQSQATRAAFLKLLNEGRWGNGSSHRQTARQPDRS